MDPIIIKLSISTGSTGWEKLEHLRPANALVVFKQTPSLKLTAISPLKKGPYPKRKPDRLPTIHFQGQTCC